MTPSIQADRGELIRHFLPRSERATGRLRQVAAVLGLVGSIALLLSRLPVAIVLVALVGILVSVFWWRAGSRLVAEAGQSDDPGLRLYRHGAAWREGDDELWLAWSEVSRVDIDEEQLRVRVRRDGAADVTLEPRYADTSLDELAIAIAEVAARPGPYTDGNRGQSQSRTDDLQ